MICIHLAIRIGKKKTENADLNGIFEYPLFTDAHYISSQIENASCPYKILNPNVMHMDNVVLMRLVLRLEDYSINPYISAKQVLYAKRDKYYDFYLGSNTADQIAVLLSLGLGIRVKAGDCNRIFKSNDNFGTPIAQMIHNNPPPIRLASAHPVLPSALKNNICRKMNSA